MRNKIALLLAVLMLASALLCGCSEEKTLEPWTMPAVDAKPTVEPTPVPTYGGGSPEEYIWNEAESFDMSDPGAAPESVQETVSHNDCLALRITSCRRRSSPRAIPPISVSTVRRRIMTSCATRTTAALRSIRMRSSFTCHLTAMRRAALPSWRSCATTMP